MKISYTLTIMLAALIVAIGVTAVVGTEIIKSNNSEIVDREIPKVVAALEMEINVNEMTDSLLQILEQDLQHEKFEDDINDFLEFNKKYKELIRTDEEKNAVQKLDLMFSDYVDTARQFLNNGEVQMEKIQERRDLLNLSIEKILDDELQANVDPSDPDFSIKLKALDEMEINIHELISASRGYLLKPDAFLKDRISDSIDDFRYFQNQFNQNQLTEYEMEQMDLLGTNFDTAEILTHEIIDLEDEKISLIHKYDELSINIDAVLDDEIQRLSAEKMLEDDQQSRETIDGLLTILIALFIITLTIGFIFATRLGKRLAKIVRVTNAIKDGDLDVSISGKAKDEIGTLARAMKDMASQLKRVGKEKEEFVAMITHDLKQPLVPISGNAEMLQNPKMGELNEMQKDCVDEIAANASRQLSMIDNLVSAQKLGAGAMTYEIEDLSSKDILNDSIKTHSPIMKDKNIQYFDSSTEDIKIKGDRRRILEAYTNLIQNAHDFVPQDGKIEIGVNNGDKEVTFFCKDNGEGIPKDKQDKLFKKYGQVETSATRKFGGTGLGLAVSQEIVEGMGGKIWLESDAGKGTTFFFTIQKAG